MAYVRLLLYNHMTTLNSVPLRDATPLEWVTWASRVHLTCPPRGRRQRLLQSALVLSHTGRDSLTILGTAPFLLFKSSSEIAFYS